MSARPFTHAFARCFPASEPRLGSVAASYITSCTFSPPRLSSRRGYNPRFSALTCEIKRIKSVSVSGGDRACSLISLPNRCGSPPVTARYARSVTPSLWMIHGYKLPPTGMSRGGKQHVCRAINLPAFNGLFSSSMSRR